MTGIPPLLRRCMTSLIEWANHDEILVHDRLCQCVARVYRIMVLNATHGRLRLQANFYRRKTR